MDHWDYKDSAVEDEGLAELIEIKKKYMCSYRKNKTLGNYLPA